MQTHCNSEGWRFRWRSKCDDFCAYASRIAGSMEWTASAPAWPFALAGPTEPAPADAHAHSRSAQLSAGAGSSPPKSGASPDPAHCNTFGSPETSFSAQTSGIFAPHYLRRCVTLHHRRDELEA